MVVVAVGTDLPVTYSDLLQRLQVAGGVGLDMSPGDALAGEAYAALRHVLDVVRSGEGKPQLTVDLLNQLVAAELRRCAEYQVLCESGIGEYVEYETRDCPDGEYVRWEDVVKFLDMLRSGYCVA